MVELLLGLTDEFTERKRECCTFRPGNCYYLTLFDILFFNILSWVLLLNDCLERRSPHIIAKLDEHITFVSFWKVFLIPLSWLFFYMAFLWYVHITYFWNIIQRFIVPVIKWGFCNNELMKQFYINKKVLIFFRNGKLFLRNF